MYLYKHVRTGLLLLILCGLFATLCSCTLAKNLKTDSSERSDGKAQGMSFPEKRTLVFDGDTCNPIFGASPDKAAEQLESVYWIQGNYESITVNYDGDLVITLNRQHQKNWLDYCITGLNEARQTSNDYVLTLDSSYTQLTISANSDTSTQAVFGLMEVIPLSGLYQILNGKQPDEWSIDVTLKAVESDTVLWSGAIPGDTFRLSDDVWVA